MSLSRSTPTLARIAEALGVPVTVFTQSPAEAGELAASIEECAALLDAFRRIRNRQARRRCLNYVKTAADRDEQP